MNETSPKTDLRILYEKYYTKTNISTDCIDFFDEHIKPDYDNDLIIEPSAGDGAFSNILFSRYKNVLAYDIMPEHDSIEKQNFLEMKIPTSWYDRTVHVITNPPFGKQSGKAKQFIRKCSRFANTISFILPNSFRKKYMQIPFPSEFHLINIKDLPEDSFIFPDGLDTSILFCCFQVWKKDCNIPGREYIKYKPKSFKFVLNTENPDFSIRRVGINTGRISRSIDKTISTHFFIKVNDNIDKDKFYNKFSNVTFPNNINIGSRSINKNELIKTIESISPHTLL
uniref:Methyltransferase small domain-containing protein n=1 Tax=viral metagenome TaxID=1070528 RepID=A0A6C0LIZ8_9ZZZZ